MEEKLDFSLPEKKDKSSIASKLLIVLVVALLVLASVNLFLIVSRQNKPAGTSTSKLSAEQTKELANKLAQRNLNQQAAKVWQDYLAVNNLPDAECAKVLFQIGAQFEKANLYADAIEYYYRSEMAAKLNELEPQINSHIQDCLEKLGKFSALRYELMDRTGFKQSEQAGSKVVAEIGSEKITEADLDAIIENNIDNQLKPMAMFMTPEQLNNQKKEALEQFKSSQAKMQFLQRWIAEEILYRQALQEKLPDKDQVKVILGQVQRNVLSQQLMNEQLAAKIHITDTDLQTYYTANKDKYAEPTDVNDPNSPKRQKSFGEVRQQVMMTLLNKKRQDVQQDYLKEMMDKYNVVIHTSALTDKEKTESDEKAGKPAKQL
jgi:hypothetical protein